MAIDIAALVARILLAALFLEAGVSGLFDMEAVAGYFSGLGLPFAYALSLAVPVFETAGALCLLLGLAMRPAALVLALFAVSAAFIGHYGQGVGDPVLALMHRQAFMKDIAVAGGLVALAALGPGRFALMPRRPQEPD
ncbi:DoxX family protein [Aquamicrobium sp. LC103]|uniref:DoxX family protein n=1 Tax=Aquamicrobium sp. LC103 TaxID=1120658 RepID=UPI00063EB345|nr:DoxX family protein [Aquamicrobium sp. LC103]TKT69167.1 DoxX family protein [Aquamicrobium sp. LC103]